MQTVASFTLLREQALPELNTYARLYRHDPTGAEVLSLENDDENKVFGITFRTPPEDSTGIAHILEHSVLCGSRNYPLKKPFVELLKGSLKTFLNAMTYPDKTVYPVASVNTRDFYNLARVYLDAVLFPLITPDTLRQEGWHYELEQPDGPLTFKGVVFNEMKGANSSPDRLLYVQSQQAIFPDTPYRVDSGGDPTCIPDLTYEQFKRFHETYYHPSNARIFFYGDDDPAERLRLLDEYLSQFERITVDSAIPLQAPFSTPVRVERVYDSSSNADPKSLVNVNWLLSEATDLDTALGLSILQELLVGTPAAPLRKALIESGLGENLTGSGIYELRQLYFTVGLKGVPEAHVAAVEPLILETLAGLVREGIDPDQIDAAMNTVEFQLRENNTGSYPRGLWLMLVALNTWLYDADPIAPLAFEAPLAAIKQRLASGEQYFEGLIQRFLVDNTHRVHVILRPDSELARRLAEAERARLDAAFAAMSPSERYQVREDMQRLQTLQTEPDSPEALASLPTLTRADLDPTTRSIPIETHQVGATRVFTHDLFTNKIVYLDLGLDLRMLPQQLLPYTNLFGRMLLESGTRNETMTQLMTRIGRTTGGIRTQTLISTAVQDGVPVAYLMVRGKATAARSAELLDILRDTLLFARLDDRDRFRQIVLEEKAQKESGLVPSGHQVVNLRLRSLLSESDWANEQIGGVSYLFFLRRLLNAIDEDWSVVQATLEQIRRLLVKSSAMIGNLTCDAETCADVLPRLQAFLEGLPAGEAVPEAWAPKRGPGNEGLSIPAQVNYVGRGLDLYRAGYQLHGSALVINNYLRTTWLWNQIREQGGAYGGFSLFDSLSGIFSFVSYRDPNLLRTLNVYDQTVDFLRELELDERDLTRAIIGTISELDAYQLPDARGYTSLVRTLTGNSEERRQRIRNEVLNTTAEDFRAFAAVLEQVRRHGQVVVMGSRQQLEGALSERPDLFEITPVL